MFCAQRPIERQRLSPAQSEKCTAATHRTENVSLNRGDTVDSWDTSFSMVLSAPNVSLA